MEKISIQDLKRRLSAILTRAENGEPILITRHRRPVARLTSAQHAHVHQGARFGSGSLSRLLKEATAGRYLEVLAEDRRPEEHTAPGGSDGR